MVEHLYVQLGDLALYTVLDITPRRKTDRQTNGIENPAPATTVGVGRKNLHLIE